MDSGRLPSGNSGHSNFTHGAFTVFGGCHTFGFSGSILSTRPAGEPSSGHCDRHAAKEHVHVWFFPEAMETFTSTLSDTGSGRRTVR